MCSFRIGSTQGWKEFQDTPTKQDLGSSKGSILVLLNESPPIRFKPLQLLENVEQVVSIGFSLDAHLRTHPANLDQTCSGLNANEIQISQLRIISVFIGKKSLKHTQFCQIWSNMKMSDNTTKYEVLIKEYLRSIRDISEFDRSDWLSRLRYNVSLTCIFKIGSERTLDVNDFLLPSEESSASFLANKT